MSFQTIHLTLGDNEPVRCLPMRYEAQYSCVIIDNFEKALQLNPYNYKMLIDRADIYSMIERYDLALSDYILANIVKPDYTSLKNKETRENLDLFLSKYYPGRVMGIYSNREILAIADGLFAHFKDFGSTLSPENATRILTRVLLQIDRIDDELAERELSRQGWENSFAGYE
jgi:tetratricopeptide (TPR) repeat protein